MQSASSPRSRAVATSSSSVVREQLERGAVCAWRSMSTAARPGYSVIRIVRSRCSSSSDVRQRPRLEIELPVVHHALEHAVLDDPEALEIRAQVRAPLLHHVLAAAEHLVARLGAARVVPLAVRHPLDRQALEERVDVLVVLALAVRAEPAREEQLVHPVLDVAVDARLDERALGVDAVADRFAGPLAHGAGREVDEHTDIAEMQQHRRADPGAGERRDVEQRLPPLGQRARPRRSDRSRAARSTTCAPPRATRASRRGSARAWPACRRRSRPGARRPSDARCVHSPSTSVATLPGTISSPARRARPAPSRRGTRSGPGRCWSGRRRGR